MNMYPVRLGPDGRMHGPAERWFDSTRYTGDREFIAAPIAWEYSVDGTGSDMPHQRPKSYDEAVAWITANIEPEGNRERLIALCAFLRDHADAWIEVSV